MTARLVATWAMLLAVGGAALGCEVSSSDPDSGAMGGEAGSASGAGGGRAGDGGSSAGLGGGSSGGTGGMAPDEVRKILDDPAVKSALDEAREAGVDIVAHTERDARDPTGYYAYALRAGTWVASGNGANVGFATAAAELRVDLLADDIVDTAMVGSFDGATPASYGLERGYLLRGAGNEVTLYGRRGAVCDLSGSSYAVSQAYIWTGTLEDGTGNWLDQRQFIVTTATEGELTSDCEEALVGNVEVVGGWAVAAIPIATNVPVDDLELMCVEGRRGYVPTELWAGTDGTACECTTDFAVSCES